MSAVDAPPRPREVRGDYTLTPRTLLVAAIAMGVGACATLAAVLLLDLITVCTNLFFFGRLSLAPASPVDHEWGALVVLVPVAGALIVGLMARFGSERIRGHGIPEAMEAILLRGSRIEPKIAVLKPVSAAISIGSGGPFGAEGPIIMTGGAVGSIIAQMLHLTAAERKTLLVAGAAAGMSAVFGTPIAAVLLAVELLLFEWKPRSLVPVALAAATAAALRPALVGTGPIFPIPAHNLTLDVTGFAACLVAGLAAGVLSGFLSRSIYVVEDAFARLPIHWMWWPAIGAVVVGVGGWIDPRVLGVGYENIGGLLDGTLVGNAVLGLMVLKSIVWIASLGTGTSGGVLAPLLTIGAALGALEARVLPDGGPGFWPLIGMAAALGGTMRCPLAAVLFAMEATHDLDALVPLLVAVSASYLFTTLTLPRSILTEKIARRGVHLSHEYAIDPLEIHFVREVMQPVPEVLAPEARVADLGGVPVDQRLIPVVDGGRLVGVVTRRDLADAPAGQAVGAWMREPVVVWSDDILRVVVNRMAESGRTCLPVLDHAASDRLVGLVTLSDLLRARAHELVAEGHRERPIPLRWPRWRETRKPGASSS
jgi:CIC family chloride channel protein